MIAIVLVVVLVLSGQKPDLVETLPVPLTNSSLDFDSLSTKIDVRAVCNGSLAYMTFIDGEAADLFVAECIEGGHPEVIERYLSDNGIDTATI